MKKSINWKVFFILLGSSLVSIVCVFPYIITVQGELLSKSEVSLEFIFIAQFLQSIVLFSVTAFIGLFLSQKVGFRLPLLTALTEKGDSKKILKIILRPSVAWGTISALLIYIADFLFVIPGITTHQANAPVWQTLAASFYGGITEEMLMRLFLMTLFVWIGMKLFKQIKPSKIGVIIPIFLAAIIFGLGHLPITASLTLITPLVIVRAITLNGIGGIIFGWLYWKKGLESAIIAHFTTDIVLLTLFPLLIN
jgi:membrane protease YdiL (CAAX protease family)